MTGQAAMNSAARDSALAALASMQVRPTGLVEYQSRGKVLVLGGDQGLEFESGQQDSGTLSDVLLASGRVEPDAVIFPSAGTQVAIDGHLGAFSVSLGVPGTAKHEVMTADLILDLGNEPVLTMPVKPPGYLVADGGDEGELLSALDQLEDLVGTFEKPQYYTLDTNICAHRRSGRTGCTRCLEACPTLAISSCAESIEVDPHLCQGCGICTATCPSGAIRYAYPEASATQDFIRKLLRHYLEEGGRQPVIGLVCESACEPERGWPDQLLPVVVEELTSVGMDVWLSALAYGAAAVVVIDTGTVPAGASEALDEQLDFARQLLAGMGFDCDVLVRRPQHELNLLELPVMPEIARATHAGTNDKRQATFFAIDHLAAQASPVENELSLPPRAPFGRLHVDSERCTLCMGCASVCPSTAVHSANDMPRLLFSEERCTQCGICQSACPEGAITLQARLLTDPGQRRSPIVLNEESPFLCLGCGKAFATRSIIDTIMEKLSGHAMFQDERAKKRLMMCEDCRVVDAIQDEEAMLTAQGGIGRREPAAGDKR